MAKKRDQIKMSAQETAEFMAAQRTISVCTLGKDGWPHLIALWYVMRGTEPWIYTYAKSQKVRNLERDERATLLVEAGHEYNELKGVMLKARGLIHRDLDTVAAMAEDLFSKYQGGDAASIDDAVKSSLRQQATKRVAIQFQVDDTVTWDHAKLGGAY